MTESEARSEGLAQLRRVIKSAARMGYRWRNVSSSGYVCELSETRRIWLELEVLPTDFVYDRLTDVYPSVPVSYGFQLSLYYDVAGLERKSRLLAADNATVIEDRMQRILAQERANARKSRKGTFVRHVICWLAHLVSVNNWASLQITGVCLQPRKRSSVA